MAQRFYNTEKAAEVLGVSVEEVKRMQQDREIYGYRDGADWKFKTEDIEKVAAERAAGPPADELSEDDDVLLTEVELGESDPGASGTVIGMEPAEAETSGLELAGSDVQAAESDIQLAEDAPAEETPADEVGSQVSQFEELDLTLEDDLTIEDSVVGARDMAEEGEPQEAAAGSAVDLSGEDLADDDMVLGGGSGAGSDIAIGGDSGISLVDPADSGFALDEPLDLAGGTDVSLELHEDDDLLISEDTGSSAELQTDDDFLLTPLEEVGDEDSESGSQVIALDTDAFGEEAGASGGAMAAMLGEDLGGEAGLGMEPGGSPLGAPAGMAEGPQFAQTAATMPEAPYSALNIVSLVICALVLLLCGIMVFDLIRNMWSWDGYYEINSSLMDWIISLFA